MVAWLTNSHDGAFLLSLGVVLPLESQPEGKPDNTNANHRPVEAIAHWDQQRVERPFDELSEGGDDLLGIHDSKGGLTAKIQQHP